MAVRASGKGLVFEYPMDWDFQCGGTECLCCLVMSIDRSRQRAVGEALREVILLWDQLCGGFIEDYGEVLKQLFSIGYQGGVAGG